MFLCLVFFARYMQNTDLNVFSYSRVYKEKAQERDKHKTDEEKAREKEERKKKPVNEFKELWVARTYLTISEALPVLSRFPFSPPPQFLVW